jgi:hypothetical protein
MNSLVYVSYFQKFFQRDKLRYTVVPHESQNFQFTQDENLIRFILTLREVARFQGHIVVFMYGGVITEPMCHILQKYEVEILSVFSEFHPGYYLHLDPIQTTTVNRKYLDIINYLDAHPEFEYVANFDTDSWFNEPIDSFIEKSEIEGVLLSKGAIVDGFLFYGNFAEKFPTRAADYEKKVALIKNLDPKKLEGTISASFMAGRAKSFLKKCRQYKHQVETYYLPWIYGIDQFFVTESFNSEQDKIAQEFNIAIEKKDVSIKNGHIYWDDIKIIGIHKGYEIFDILYPEWKSSTFKLELK